MSDRTFRLMMSDYATAVLGERLVVLGLDVGDA
jgi:hypothetical protein